eukprot:1084574-Pelagomonas_calceolata.AAC.2
MKHVSGVLEVKYGSACVTVPFAFTSAGQPMAGSFMEFISKAQIVSLLGAGSTEGSSHCITHTYTHIRKRFCIVQALLGGTPPSAGSLPWHIHTPPTGRHPHSTRGMLQRTNSRGREHMPQSVDTGAMAVAAWEVGQRGGQEDSKSSSAGGGAGSIVRARDVSALALVRRPSWVEHSLRTQAGVGQGRAELTCGGSSSSSNCAETAVHRSLSLGSVGSNVVHAHAHAYAVQQRQLRGDGRQQRDRAGVNLPVRPSYPLPSYPSSFDRMPLLQLPSRYEIPHPLTVRYEIPLLWQDGMQSLPFDRIAPAAPAVQ